MKIYKSREGIFFSELTYGSVFVYEGAEYLKIPICDLKVGTRTAVTLDTGLLVLINGDERIIPKPDAILYPNGLPKNSK